MRRHLLLLVLSSCVLSAQDFSRWASALESRGIRVSAGIWDVDTGKVLERHLEEEALIPASTTKVITTYALLKTLKPDTTLETEIWGDLEEGLVRGDLTFKGAWDPMLTSERIWMIAQDLKKLGMRQVTGNLVLDQGASDGQLQPQGWENTTTNTLPWVLPLSANFNRDDAGKIAPNPERQSRETIQRIFQEAGISFEGQPNGKGVPRRLMSWGSPPLRNMIMDINKWSNNFMVEMLLKSYGGGSWPRGVERVQTFYQAAFGLGPETIRITDGSGLSKDNRLSARTLATILRAAYHDFEVGPEFVSSLKIIGGEPWRLRVKDLNLTRRVRVKTGHLDRVTSACGYLQTLNGQVRVFAIILNGPAQEEDVWSQVSRWAN